MRPSSIKLYSAFIGCVSALDPWYFTWTDPSNQSHPESGSKPSDCIEIDNPKGKYFDWEAGDGWCIYFWENPNCTGTAGAGYTCKTWPWRANATYHDLRAFKVVVNGTDYMSSSSSSTTTAASTGTATNTSVATSQSSDNSDGGSLSKGAIAGIVVGVVVGMAILAALVWLFWKRRHKPPSNTEPPVGPTDSDTREIGKEKPETEEASSPSGASELHHEPKKKVVELMGSDSLVEMSDTHRVVELDTIETTVGRLPEKS